LFEVELAHKLPELKAHEDYLTSCFFGALKYLPPKEALFPLLNRSFNYRLNTNLESYLRDQKTDLTQFNKVQFYFWPRSSEYGEPDLLIILEGLSGSFLIPIEVKYYSEKHGEEEKDQLMKYYIGFITVDGRKTFNNEAIKKSSGKLLAFIYLTKFEAQHEIEETIRLMESRGISDAKSRLFHLRWQDVSRVIESILSKELVPYKRCIYNDIMKLMALKNFLPFRGFSKLPKELSAGLLSQFPSLFESSYMEQNRFVKFPDLPHQLSAESRLSYLLTADFPWRHRQHQLPAG
jgi:hypothetical protein